MIWTIFLFISLFFVLLTILGVVFNNKMRRKNLALLDRPKILFAGVALTSFALFIPIYAVTFKETSCGVLETVFVSFHNMIRLFIVDASFDVVTDSIYGLQPWLAKAYTVLFSVIFVSAPLLTFGFVLSFFKNVSSFVSYLWNFKSDVYIFSALNPQSVALAEDLAQNDKQQKRFFVFTAVDKQEENVAKLLKRIERINAVYFNNNINAISFNLHSKKSSLVFFTISENHQENVTQGIRIADKFKFRDNTKLYVFTTQVESELLMLKSFEDCKDENNENVPAKIKVRRIDPVYSLIIRNLYETGFENIFEKAVPDEATGEKKISAVVVGMGEHGSNMLKSLSWFCQMDGYRPYIYGFDIDECAKEKFVSQCPELMDDKYNGVFDVEGDARYEITIYDGIDVEGIDFDNIAESLPDVSYVFVALGDDEKNISTAVKLRALYARKGLSPAIQAVVYDCDKTAQLRGIKNFKGQPYDIDFIGDDRYSYSEKVVIGLDIELIALSRHLAWGDEKEFWQYDYNYRSSVASAIHREMKIKCRMPEIEKKPQDRENPENIEAIRKLEHARWNAYMRSIGYVFSGKMDKKTRNDLAKTHHLLVPYDMLPESEKIKDDD